MKISNQQQSKIHNKLQQFGYQQQLSRHLNLWQLTAFGLNYMIPIAPALIFGFIMVTSGGTVAIPYALACIAMLFTANSYIVMIKKIPVAGSLYSYVSFGLSPHVGFVAGWTLLLDYILIPTITSMGAALSIHQLFPHIPYHIWLILFAVLPGLINLLGVNLMAKLGLWLLLIGEIIIVSGFIIWGYAVQKHGIGVGHLLSTKPFEYTSIASLATATSIAVLSYLGFDAITTLSEEAINPHKDIPRAIILTIIIGAITMFLTGYIGMLTIKHWQQYIGNMQWQNTALFHVAQITGGKPFEIFYTAGFLLAMAVFNVVATAAGARLLFGMGRDHVLPAGIFSAINKKFKTPHWNIILIVTIEYTIGSIVTLDRVAELINYGALIGFLLLNFSVFWMHTFSSSYKQSMAAFTFKQRIIHQLLPILGVLVTLWVMSGLRQLTWIVGTTWLIIGVIYGAMRSKGYRIKPQAFRE